MYSRHDPPGDEADAGGGAWGLRKGSAAEK